MGVFNSLEKIDTFFSERLSKYACTENIFISFISFLGSFFVTIIFLAVIYFLPLANIINLIVVIIFSISIDTIIVFIIKFSVRRRRKKDKKYFNRIDTYSFPSGHVSRLSAFILPLINYPVIMFFFLFLVIIVSYARMFRLYHYFTDCFAGFIIGLFSGMLSMILSDVYIDLIKNAVDKFFVIM